MADLATVDDLVVRLGHDLTSTEAARAAVLLGDASSLVRGYTRQAFDLVTDDEVVLRPVGATIRLPQRPVIAVDSVFAVGGAPELPDVELAGWTWDGIDIVDLAYMGPLVQDVPDWWYTAGRPDTYRVTYDHGYTAVPDDVIAVVCAMVNRVLTAPTLVEGLTSERIGQYGYQFAQFAGGQSPGPAVRLSQADKDALADAGYKRRSATVQVRL